MQGKKTSKRWWHGETRVWVKMGPGPSSVRAPLVCIDRMQRHAAPLNL